MLYKNMEQSLPQPRASATIFSLSSFVVSFIKILFIDSQPPYLYYIPICFIGKYLEAYYENY